MPTEMPSLGAVSLSELSLALHICSFCGVSADSALNFHAQNQTVLYSMAMVKLSHSISFGQKLGLTRSEAGTLAKLRTPEKIQDYVSSIPINHEKGGDTCLSVVETLRQRRAHCIEGALVAACSFWLNGKPPLLMDFQAMRDDDHVVALFRHRGYWGAISKSNHVWLRWRDPIYRNLRELALSYFHEYVTGSRKTLWNYSVAFDLRRFDPKMWITNKESCWDIASALDDTRHYALISSAQAKRLRPRDSMEIRADKLVEYNAFGKKKVA